ncbi:peptide-methionine (S)-S-oxide reductase [Mariprofundus ferrinatatus]|uniref:Peptide methionine sulfoxide reductase MsrA n=1 Tax=Mariprofundus ferrinatatus TaxID=1921087 RepID=A0A2K8L158_9PROT|nr:peptide-methionine (S)-S-oxide reductase MsrA [Mariprofundus ferrinatatus]ATX81017.1 peptide-methionine (S)-S-oxide reductase [Mariprofundus ferrinatatus]
MKRIILLAMAMMMALTNTTEAKGMEKATFAAGCFWCMEHPFDELDGVISTTSGYTGGSKRNPSYQEVSAGSTGHTEAIQIVFDPARVSYAKLLEVYWRNSDPTTANRQFCDVGSQYRPAIFYHNGQQHELAQASKLKIEKTKSFAAPLVTEIVEAGEFWPAEEYHQNYYLKNPIRYKFYRYNCGRDQRLEQLWGASHE